MIGIAVPLQKGRIADFVVNGAMVIGHESSGYGSSLADNGFPNPEQPYFFKHDLNLDNLTQSIT